MKKIYSFLVILSSAVFLTGCVNNKEAVVLKQVKKNALDVDAFSITTNLEETKEIHTAAQKEYLAYNGDYSSIPENKYPDGQQHLSDPVAVNLAWNFTAPSGKTVSRYDVIVGKEADLSDGYAIKGTSNPSLDVYNSYLGDNYFRIVANYSDGTSDGSKIQKYKVDDTYPRNLKIDGMTNCRDMGGGRVLEDGGKIKQGLIFRTSGTNSWGNGNAKVPDNITNDGKEELLTRLGCVTEINVNNSGSNQVGVKNFVPAYMYYDGGKHHLYRNAEPLKQVFHALANPDNYPVFYHCRIGTDRTGLCAIMISGLLGVSENDIFQDYLFSNFGNIQEKRYIGEKAGRDNIMNYINDLKAFPGEKFQNKVYNYLLSIGVPASELNSIIDILTEGNKASGNDNSQEVILAGDFDAYETELKTNEKDRTANANPEKYYTLGAEQYVTAYFDTKYNGKANLVAYLGSTDSSASKKMVDSISAQVDGNEIAIDEDITFSSAGFGTGASRTYYAAVVLGQVDVTKGTTEVSVVGIANNLNIGALALIPEGKVSPASDNPSSKKGCGGSIIATASLVSLFAAGASALFLIKRRKED